MATYVIQYSLDNGNTYLTYDTSYPSRSRADLNEILPISGSRSAKFRTYISGSTLGTPQSDTQYVYAGGTHLQLTSYYTSNEYKYMCVVNRGEFQDTSNPTAYVSGSGSLLPSLEDDAFRPLATGVGLYDDNNMLIAIGKFANPIRIEKDLDSVFVIKFDV